MKEILLLLILALISLYSYRRLSSRNALDVLLDLSKEENELEEISKKDSASSSRTQRQKIRKELWFMSEKERLHFLKVQTLLPFAGGMILVFGVFAFSPRPMTIAIPVFLAGLALGYLIAQRRYVMAQERVMRQIDFFLPIVMERMVMAVQAGLDVFSAMKSIVDIERRDNLNGIDPVTRLADRACQLTEQGFRFEEALLEASQKVASPALKHAFMHLGVAHKEGGELIFPLKELSDATQLYYQETLEEEIAGMPVKATLPLLMTFAGLIIFFITPPLLQILDLTKSSLPG